jgi:hypothetical protein
MLARLLERGKTSGREDDNVESIKKRFRTYTNDTMPVIEYYASQDKVAEVSYSTPNWAFSGTKGLPDRQYRLHRTGLRSCKGRSPEDLLPEGPICLESFIVSNQMDNIIIIGYMERGLFT